MLKNNEATTAPDLLERLQQRHIKTLLNLINTLAFDRQWCNNCPAVRKIFEKWIQHSIWTWNFIESKCTNVLDWLSLVCAFHWYLFVHPTLQWTSVKNAPSFIFLCNLTNGGKGKKTCKNTQFRHLSPKIATVVTCTQGDGHSHYSLYTGV